MRKNEEDDKKTKTKKHLTIKYCHIKACQFYAQFTHLEWIVTSV